MLDLVLKLISHCIQLVKEREKQDRSIFVDFVEPLIEDFKKVHEDYLKSFAKYRECLSTKNTDIAIKELSEQLDTDALFSSSIRADLLSMGYFGEDQILKPLVYSIYEYLDYALLNRDECDISAIMCNSTRDGFKKELRWIGRKNLPEDKMRKEALKILDLTVSNLQKKYVQVIDNAQKVKIKLLK